MLHMEDGECVLDGPDGDFSAMLREIHMRIRATMPSIVRVAIATYDPDTDILKTFSASTLGHDPLDFHEARLQDIPSLKRLAESRSYRVVHNLREYGNQSSIHTKALVDHGFLSSATLPIHQKDKFLGFVYFNATEMGRFVRYEDTILPVYANLLAVALQKYRQSIQILRGALTTARTFSHLRDEETSGHLARISRYARLIAWTMKRTHGIDQEFVENVFQFSPLHDIGKVGVPDNILLKPGRLDDAEWKVMQKHVDAGVQIIDTMLTDFSLSELAGVGVLRNIVKAHHERWDGTGYPSGLKGEEIPIEARIVAVADVMDALASVRPYKPAWSFEEALAHLKSEKGKHFDPDCVDALISAQEAAREIMQQFSGSNLVEDFKP